jgi:hypothetical protein
MVEDFRAGQIAAACVNAFCGSKAKTYNASDFFPSLKVLETAEQPIDAKHARERLLAFGASVKGYEQRRGKTGG